MEEQEQHEGRRRRWLATSRARTLAAVGGIGAVVLLGAIGVAVAQSDSTTTTTVPPSSSNTPANPVKPPSERGPFRGPGGFDGPGHLFEKFGGLGVGPFGAVHGEFVTRNGNGFRTIVVQTGQVASVSPDSITVKSDDGYTKTYNVSENTVVDAGRDGIGDVKKDDTVRITGVGSGDKPDAMSIDDVTRLSAIRQHWAPASA